MGTGNGNKIKHHERPADPRQSTQGKQNQKNIRGRLTTAPAIRGDAVTVSIMTSGGNGPELMRVTLRGRPAQRFAQEATTGDQITFTGTREGGRFVASTYERG